MSKALIRKLFWVALYTSPAIAVLIITPVTIMHENDMGYYLFSVISISIGVFFIWAVNILILYLISRSANPGRRWKMKYGISTLLCLLLAVIVSLCLFHPDPNAAESMHRKFFHFHLILFLTINIFILIIEDLVLVKEKNTMMELENARLKMMNMEAANEQLKQQVHPHFLFNSLSTLKALINSSPADAETYLLKLSDFLRYAISANRLNTVKVADELKLCIDYLEMQQIRFGNALQFTIDIPAGVKEEYYIPVFSLQVLLENAIKHNSMSPQQPLYINVTCTGDIITVSNNVQPKSDAVNTQGTGLANLQERYRILYNGDIKIDTGNGNFAVSIKAFRDEDSDH